MLFDGLVEFLDLALELRLGRSVALDLLGKFGNLGLDVRLAGDVLLDGLVQLLNLDLELSLSGNVTLDLLGEFLNLSLELRDLALKLRSLGLSGSLSGLKLGNSSLKLSNLGVGRLSISLGGVDLARQFSSLSLSLSLNSLQRSDLGLKLGNGSQGSFRLADLLLKLRNLGLRSLVSSLGLAVCRNFRLVGALGLSVSGLLGVEGGDEAGNLNALAGELGLNDLKSGLLLRKTALSLSQLLTQLVELLDAVLKLSLRLGSSSGSRFLVGFILRLQLLRVGSDSRELLLQGGDLSLQRLSGGLGVLKSLSGGGSGFVLLASSGFGVVLSALEISSESLDLLIKLGARGSSLLLKTRRLGMQGFVLLSVLRSLGAGGRQVGLGRMKLGGNRRDLVLELSPERLLRGVRLLDSLRRLLTEGSKLGFSLRDLSLGGLVLRVGVGEVSLQLLDLSVQISLELLGRGFGCVVVADEGGDLGFVLVLDSILCKPDLLDRKFLRRCMYREKNSPASLDTPAHSPP